jgi:Protein of unknown function (DUF3168)
MRAEKATYTLLSNDAGVAALIAGRIYPGRLPQNTTMPALSYELVSSVDIAPITALAGGVLLRSRVQITGLAKSYGELKALLEAARKALLFQSGLIAGVRVLGITRELIGPDLRDDDLGLYLQSVDYMVTHDET